MTIGKMRFFFYSNEHLPVHVHVELYGKICRIELATLKVTDKGGFKKHQLTKIVSIVKKNTKTIKEAWDGHFTEE